MSEITYLHYVGTDAQILALIKQMLPSPGQHNSPAHESATPKAESAAQPEPQPTPEFLRTFSVRFRQLLEEAATRGSFGQKDAMFEWLRSEGNIEASKLFSAAGAKDGKGWVPFGNGLTRNIRKAARESGDSSAFSSAGLSTGIPSFPTSWYGYTKNPADGLWYYRIESTLLPYLKAAFEADAMGNQKEQDGRTV